MNRKRIRNPRYAPEFLERKLSPSAVVGVLVTPAAYALNNPSPTDPDPTDPTTPDDGDGYPPTDPYPLPPIGPGGPA
jgi:hypothetical protein